MKKFNRPGRRSIIASFLPILLLISVLLVACGDNTTPASTTSNTTSSATTSSAAAATTTSATNSSAAAATTSGTTAGSATATTSSSTASGSDTTAAGTPAAAQSSAVPFNTPAATPNSTASADLPNLVYPGSREATAADTTTQQVLKSATGSDPTVGDFTAQKLSVLFTTDELAKIEAYYKKALQDAGFQVNNQQSGQGGSVYIFQKNGSKVVIQLGSVGPDTSQLPKEFQTVAKANDNLILIVSGKSTIEPTAVPTPVNIPGTPVATLGAGQKKIATITLDNGGVITMELYPDVAPITVENFEKLANRGFYDGLTFHRIVPGFVVQGGDPNGDGSGGPGTGRDASNTKPYTIPGEFTTKIKHDYGIVAMARAQANDSGGSQFYIVTGKAGDPSVDGLNGKYAIFGKVTSDMNVVLQIKQGDKMKTVRVENK